MVIALLYEPLDSPYTLLILAVELWVVVSVLRSRGDFIHKGVWVLLVLLFQLFTCALWFLLHEESHRVVIDDRGRASRR